MEKEEEGNPFLDKPRDDFNRIPAKFQNPASNVPKPASKNSYPSFKPIKYSEVAHENRKKEPNYFKNIISKKKGELIREADSSGKKTKLLKTFLIVIAILMLFIYIYLAYFRDSDYEIRIGENVDDAYIKDSALYVHLLPYDYESAEKINFFLIDSDGNEHLYETYHLAADHEIYPEDSSLEDFDDLRMVYAEFGYSSPAPYPTTLNSSCGNNVIDMGESCDNNNVGGKVCDDFFMHGDGELICCPGCNDFNLENCRNITYAKCQDSDSGVSYYKLGSVSSEFNYTKGHDCNKNYSDIRGSGGSYYRDKCSGVILTEYYCNGDKSIGKTEYDCSSEGKICELGRCKDPSFATHGIWDNIIKFFKKIINNLKNA